jgi:Xaa-Pro aminopeptidase
MVKTPEEVQLLRKAAKITEEAIRLTMESARAGMTGTELVQIFDNEIIRQRGIPVFSSIAIGEDSYLQNIQQPSRKRLVEGDLIRFDVGCQYQYYFSDVARTAVTGAATEKQQKYYNAQLLGEMAALDIIRDGAKISEVFQAAVQRVRESGIPDFRRHHCGHGIGIELYDPPLIAPTTAGTLLEGMVLDIEVPYYELEFGGVHSEDTILVTRGGYEPLTTLGRQLHQIRT